MREKSIFSGVARSENAHTELLCNLLNHSQAFQAIFYNFLTGTMMPSLKPRITTQFFSAEDGRPDLVFDFSGTRANLIIEVKVRSSCAATSFQTAEPTEAGYHRLGEVYFLVPRNWQHRYSISGRLLTWEGLASALCRSQDLYDDMFLREYMMLLDLEFPSIRFTEDERTMLSANEARVVVTSAIKLHRTVDSLAERFKELDFKVEGSFDASEYGYYIRSKSTGRFLLWFGMWSTYDLLLGAGYENNWHSARTFEGFLPMENSTWQVVSLNAMVLREDDDIVQSAFELLKAILDKMTAQLNGPTG
jgi:hypothetical protein